MNEHNLGENGGLRVRTPSGLDVRLTNEGVEVELTRMPFGLNLELVDPRNPQHQPAPVGSYYKIT